MASAEQRPATASLAERGARLGRDLNALGALFWGGVALVLPGPNVVLGSLAAIDVAQAGGFEWWRRHEQKKNLAKKPS
jgi:hypothetical protein